MTNAFILCDLIWKVQKSHAANRECSFNSTMLVLHLICRTITQTENIEELIIAER